MGNVFVLLQEIQVGDPLEGTDKIDMAFRAVQSNIEDIKQIAFAQFVPTIASDIKYMNGEDPEGQWCADDYNINVSETNKQPITHTITLWRRIPDVTERLRGRHVMPLTGRLKLGRYVIVTAPVKSVVA